MTALRVEILLKVFVDKIQFRWYFWWSWSSFNLRFSLLGVSNVFLYICGVVRIKATNFLSWYWCNNSISLRRETRHCLLFILLWFFYPCKQNSWLDDENNSCTCYRHALKGLKVTSLGTNTAQGNILIIGIVLTNV